MLSTPPAALILLFKGVPSYIVGPIFNEQLAGHFLGDGQVESLLPFHPYSSFAWNVTRLDNDKLAADAEGEREKLDSDVAHS